MGVICTIEGPHDLHEWYYEYQRMHDVGKTRGNYLCKGVMKVQQWSLSGGWCECGTALVWQGTTTMSGEACPSCEPSAKNLCVGDTDGDGNCPLPSCPACHPEVWRKS